MSARDLHAWSPTIRVGMPLVRGRLLDLGLQTGLPLLFSANAFARVNRDKEFVGFKLDAAAALPSTLDAALDSAGFTASVAYPDYRWEPEQYLDLVAARPWTWAACPDYCVEPQVAADAAIRRLRIEATATMFHRAANAAARRGIAVPLLPVLQGWYVDEYVWCAEQMFGSSAENWPRLVGLGSVCRRQLRGPAGVLSIVQALDEIMPQGVQLHLFGVKSGALAALAPLARRVASSDSMAWDYSLRRQMPTGRTQEARAEAMTTWHERQVQLVHAALREPRGDQRGLFPTHVRDRSQLEVALEAAGSALAQLHGSNDVSYLDAKWLTMHDAYIVEWVIHNRGVEGFCSEHPDHDYGLGVVYAAVRDALIEAGHLELSDEDHEGTQERDATAVNCK